MALGLCILISASAFSEGITDMMFNKFMSLMCGHVEIAVRENAAVQTDVIRDRHRFEKILRENAEGIKEISESISVWARVLGIAKAEGMVLTGIEPEKANKDRNLFKVYDGSFDEFISDPQSALIYKKRAVNMNVHPGDYIHSRFNNIFGQMEAVKYRVAAVLETESMFQDMAVYVHQSTLKSQLGLKPHETKRIWMYLENPLDALKFAGKIHEKCAPHTALYTGMLSGEKNTEIKCAAAAPHPGFMFTNHLSIVSGSYNAKSKNGVILPDGLSGRYRIGDSVSYTYALKYPNREKSGTTLRLRVEGFYRGIDSQIPLILLSPEVHYAAYYANLPEAPGETIEAYFKPYQEFLAKEWILMRRSSTTDDIIVKYSQLNKKPWKGHAVDVKTMYETGTQILQFQQAIDKLIYIAIIVILFIVLVGLNNTLRMTIHERKTEIGTLRAIGMQRGDVRTLFMLEYMLLACAAAAAGLLFSVLLMAGLSAIPIDGGEIGSMFLNDNRLYFLINIKKIAAFTAGLLIITAIAVFLPARRASKMKPSEALQQYE